MRRPKRRRKEDDEGQHVQLPGQLGLPIPLDLTTTDDRQDVGQLSFGLALGVSEEECDDDTDAHA